MLHNRNVSENFLYFLDIDVMWDVEGCYQLSVAMISSHRKLSDCDYQHIKIIQQTRKKNPDKCTLLQDQLDILIFLESTL